MEIHLWNIRDWATGKHKSVDDRPFGGGPGMVIMPEPVFDAVEAVQAQAAEPGQLVMLTPAGERLTQRWSRSWPTHKRLLLLCGRYEGFDERIRLGLQPREISIGDFVCNGGEVPAMVVIDTVIRYVPGVLGDAGQRDRGVAQRAGPAGVSAVHPAARLPRHGGARDSPERQPPGGRPLAAANNPRPAAGQPTGPINANVRLTEEGDDDHEEQD